jgi:hypothetical protein
MGARNRMGASAQSEQTGAQVRAELRPIKARLELRGKHPVGRDPRRMTRDELKAVGHEPMSPLQALRARCLDCCGYQEKEVALCPAVDCPSWPFRMGTDPWRKPASEARREAARRTMTRLNASRRKQDGIESSASPPDSGIAPSSAEGSEASPTWVTARFDRVPKSELHRGEREGREEGRDAQGAVVPAGIAQ